MNSIFTRSPGENRSREYNSGGDPNTLKNMTSNFKLSRPDPL